MQCWVIYHRQKRRGNRGEIKFRYRWTHEPSRIPKYSCFSVDFIFCCRSQPKVPRHEWYIFLTYFPICTRRILGWSSLPTFLKWQVAMIPFLRVKCHASGLFAMDKDIKVRIGTTLGVRRYPCNQHGKFWKTGRDIFDHTNQLILMFLTITLYVNFRS